MLEWRGNGAIGRAIRFFTKKDVNHTGAILRMPFRGCEDRRWTIEALAGGPDVNLLSTMLDEYDGHVFWYPLLERYDYARDRIASYMLMQLGKPYDYKGLLGNIFGRISYNTRAYICSELYQGALMSSGIMPTSEKVLVPGEIYKLGLHNVPTRIK
jgi:hypothetical protein